MYTNKINAVNTNKSNLYQGRNKRVNNGNSKTNVVVNSSNDVQQVKNNNKALSTENVSISNQEINENTNTTKSSIGGFFKSAFKSFSFALSNVNKFAKTAVSISKSVINTVSSVSKIVKDTIEPVSQKIKTVSESVAKKISKTASKVASTVKQLTTTASDLEQSAMEVRDSVTSIVATATKTGVSVSGDVAKIVASCTQAGMNINTVVHDPTKGIIRKTAETIFSIKNCVDSIKEPAKSIVSNVSIAYKDIEKDYKKTVKSASQCMYDINIIKNATISVSDQVISTAKTVASEIKTASIDIADKLEEPSERIKEVVAQGINEIEDDYNNYKNDNSTPVYA